MQIIGLLRWPMRPPNYAAPTLRVLLFYCSASHRKKTVPLKCDDKF